MEIELKIKTKVELPDYFSITWAGQPEYYVCKLINETKFVKVRDELLLIDNVSELEKPYNDGVLCECTREKFEATLTKIMQIIDTDND